MKALYEQLKRDEGVIYEIYNDHLGNPTFGVGHLIIETDPEYGQPLGTPVSEERVYEAFQKDVNIAIRDCVALYKPQWSIWPEEVQDIMINMAFNLGKPRLAGFRKMRAALMRFDWKEAAKEGRDSRWYYQVPNRAERLMTRLENIC